MQFRQLSIFLYESVWVEIREAEVMNMSFLEEIEAGRVNTDLSIPKLVEAALARKEGVLSSTGALTVYTGAYTGRAAKDKFFVDVPAIHDDIAWGSNNQPISREAFEQVKKKTLAYLKGKEIFVLNARAGADPAYAMKFRVITELASSSLFATQLLIRLSKEEKAAYGEPDFTVVDCPNLKMEGAKDGVRSDCCVLVDLEQHLVLINGTRYAGEIKKAIFTVMNYYMPKKGVLPMHASANQDPVSHESAIFFGLSGTGKTTLSADPERGLIGDDEHGWSDKGIFNFEGGCYAKCIDLDEAKEPEIYHAIRYGALLENVVLDEETREPDYTDRTYTENTRSGYPIEHISNAVIPSVGGIPKAVIFLTADAFGVLPPISRLSREAAMYQFVSGFTSKVAGTEVGIKEPVPTFSTLFGEPFMPRPAELYAKMLGDKLDKYGTRVYLINTGWTGGPYGTGSRMTLAYTRAMVRAALTGRINDAEFTYDKRFNVCVPDHIENVPDEVLNPRNTWADKDAYDKQADRLAEMFQNNFAQKYQDMDADIVAAGPKPLK